MAILPAAPNADELAASTTLQAIGGLWIPAAVLALLIASLHSDGRLIRNRPGEAGLYGSHFLVRWQWS